MSETFETVVAIFIAVLGIVFAISVIVLILSAAVVDLIDNISCKYGFSYFFFKWEKEKEKEKENFFRQCKIFKKVLKKKDVEKDIILRLVEKKKEIFLSTNPSLGFSHSSSPYFQNINEFWNISNNLELFSPQEKEKIEKINSDVEKEFSEFEKEYEERRKEREERRRKQEEANMILKASCCRKRCKKGGCN